MLVVTAGTLAAVDKVLQWQLHIPSNFLKKIVYHDSTGLPQKRLKPNLNVELVGAFSEFKFRITTNEEGFRNSLPYLHENPGRYTIIFSGDSQTAGTGVNDHETFVSLVGQRLNKPVLNTGCYGYNTVEEWQILRKVLRQYKPELVILCFYAGNDPYENYRFRRYLGNPYDAPRARQSNEEKFELSSLKQYLKKNSSIYNLAIRLRKFTAVNDLLYRLNLVEKEPPLELVVYGKKQSSQKEQFWKATEAALERVRQEVQGHGARLVVVNIPDRCYIDEVYWAGWLFKYRLKAGDFDLLEPSVRLKDFCREKQVDFLDLNEAFKKESLQGNNMYWKFDLHLSTLGNEVVAREILNFLHVTQ